MIVLQKSVPEIYYNQSRDFQFLARAFEVLFNYEKTNVDVIRGFPLSNNFDDRLLTLLAYTLGFATKHNYNSQDLFSVCSVFAELLNKKGSLDAIYLAIYALLSAQQIDEDFEVRIDKSDDAHNLVITLPISTKDLVLLEDLFDYILPAGFTYTFKFASFSKEYPGATIETQDARNSKVYTSDKLGGVANKDAQRFNFDSPQNELQQVNTGVVVKPQ